MATSSAFGLSQLLERQSVRSTTRVEARAYVRDIIRCLPGDVAAARGLMASVPVWLAGEVVDALQARGVELDEVLPAIV